MTIPVLVKDPEDNTVYMIISTDGTKKDRILVIEYSIQTIDSVETLVITEKIFSVKDADRVFLIIGMGSKHFIIIYVTLPTNPPANNKEQNLFGFCNYGTMLSGTEVTPSLLRTQTLFSQNWRRPKNMFKQGGFIDKQRIALTYFQTLHVIEFAQEVKDLPESAGIVSPQTMAVSSIFESLATINYLKTSRKSPGMLLVQGFIYGLNTFTVFEVTGSTPNQTLTNQPKFHKSDFYKYGSEIGRTITTGDDNMEKFYTATSLKADKGGDLNFIFSFDDSASPKVCQVLDQSRSLIIFNKELDVGIDSCKMLPDFSILLTHTGGAHELLRINEIGCDASCLGCYDG